MSHFDELDRPLAIGRLNESEGRARAGSARIAHPSLNRCFASTVLMVRPAAFGFNEETGKCKHAHLVLLFCFFCVSIFFFFFSLCSNCGGDGGC